MFVEGVLAPHTLSRSMYHSPVRMFGDGCALERAGGNGHFQNVSEEGEVAANSGSCEEDAA